MLQRVSRRTCPQLTIRNYAAKFITAVKITTKVKAALMQKSKAPPPGKIITAYPLDLRRNKHMILNYTEVVHPANIDNVPQLAHGLESTLSSHGHQKLKEYDSDEYNFAPCLSSITQPEDFNFEMLSPYKIASSDQVPNFTLS